MRQSYKNLLYLMSLTSLSLLVFACTPRNNSYQGYVEGELRYIGTNFSGELTDLYVRRGQQIKPNQMLFTLDPSPEKNDYAKALSQLAASKAQVEQLKVQLNLEKIKLCRRQKLFQTNAIPKETLDESTERVNSLTQQVEEANANVATAKSQLEQSIWAFGKKQKRSNIDAFVYDTYFKSGEFVASGRPVLALLAYKDIKVNFFVPEGILGTIKLGQKGVVTCDGCKPITVTIVYISPKAEFTLPIIYSEQTRSRLIFKIEAVPSINEAPLLHPGQPITVRLYDH